MTDIVEEARALLAESAKYSSHPWSVRGTVHTIVWDARGLDVAEAATSEDAALIAAAPRLLAALADECERLSAALDAMTNQAVMASGRRATIVTEDGELERLRAENARLREAMPTDEESDFLRRSLPSYGSERNLAVLARLDAAKGVR